MTETNQGQNQFSTNDSKLVQIGTDIVCVILSATLLSLPIEDGIFWPFGFIAFVPLLLRMWSRGYWAIFWFAFATFFLWFFLALQWIDEYDVVKGFPLWRIILCSMNATTYSFGFVIFFFIVRRYRYHFFGLLLPAILTLIDFKESIGFFGFPWPILCHTQASNLPFIQIASFTGCWGVTFLIINVNEALTHLIAGRFKTKILPVAVVPVVLVGLTGLYGALSLARPIGPTNIDATLVQWDQATNQQWTSEFVDSSMQAYTQLTADALNSNRANAEVLDENRSGSRKRLVVWPETAIPHAVRHQYTMTQLSEFAKSFDMTLVVGCLTQFPADGKPLDYSTAWEYQEEPKEYNSMVAFEPDGSVIPMYSKVHLVPFGEVIPMKKYIVNWFPGYPWGTSDVSPGTGFYVTDTQVGKIGVTVCYESFFPEIAREAVANGAQILVLGSNTSWFGRTRASYHHARFDVFRSVENHIWFCRAATTGISSFIDPQGRSHKETELFKSRAITMPVGLRTDTTFYTRFGDWLPGLCGLFLAILFLGLFIIKPSAIT